MYELLLILLRNIGIIAVLALVISKVPVFRKCIENRELSKAELLLLIVFFSLVGIYGTYAGVHVVDAVANSRVIGPFVGGLIGGPIVGLFSGLIAGAHRFYINPAGFTAIACVVITPLQGLIIGLFKEKFYKSDQRWVMALLLGVVAEVLHMGAVIGLSRPLEAAIELVRIIGPPMIIANAAGISIFVAILDGVFKDQEKMAAGQAGLALKIASQTIKYFRSGFTVETAQKTAEIISDYIDIAAVSFTDRSKVLAHVGVGDDHHKSHAPIMTELTHKVLNGGKCMVVPTKELVGCSNPQCLLKSAVIAPIVVDGETVGTLKLYKKDENAISIVDIELVLGLASIFSTQIELSKIEEQSKLIAEAEYNALQAQINPHFFFNAITTITSLVRTEPEKARSTLINLGQFFRGVLKLDSEIKIQDELSHVRAYLDVEKARFGDRISVEYDVADDLDCLLPPLTLQPLVENAVKHGILTKKEGGVVRISASRCDDGTMISVEDDGVGISEDKLELILNREAQRESVGLININERLKNRFGENFGLRFSTDRDRGVAVSFIIPSKDSV